MGRRPHVLVVPFPAQGHVMPLMKLSHRLVSRGIKVTFVTTEFIKAQFMAASPEKCEESDRIHLVSVPDGLEPGDDQNDLIKLIKTIPRIMEGHLEDIIRKINKSDDEQISCVIVDTTIGWALDVPVKMGIKRATYYPSPPAFLALNLKIPKLIEDGIINNNGKTYYGNLCCYRGTNKKNEMALSLSLTNNHAVKVSNWVLCNSFYELDPLLHDLIPNLLPIGPLLSSNRLEQPSGSFWPEDSTCLSWLNKQPARSVIYVAFGSIAIFNQHQFDELALGLELVGLTFLWVVRSDHAVYPDGFRDRVAHHGKIVKWVPQQKVLAHPSIACFFTHCGWNSIMDGLSMGVPFIGWPYFSDHFYIKRCICDVWKVGLGLDPEEDGIVSRHQIKSKVENLLHDEGIRVNVLKMKEIARQAVSDGGSSSKNLQEFIKEIMTL
ncbi:hypothetical protein HHK36_024244 [Tetracentron sinense]|uniref:Glycosyltransferase N-terminal domain-containing protein n=1 Tax=Tetracentron sinense TaxID=13715 RepID=A0A834YKN2_TETSI|nr:hypothetical protein HHK36_024244 [Tetracentron sinense]